jgi:CheY-like chemotaxis protein
MSLNILIIDDDKDDHEFLITAINQVIPNSNVVSKFDGAEGLAYLHNSAILLDVILLDINMPKLCGENTLKSIKNDFSLKHIPVVMMTTSSNPFNHSYFITLGASEYFQKPPNMDGFIWIINQIKGIKSHSGNSVIK